MSAVIIQKLLQDKGNNSLKSTKKKKNNKQKKYIYIYIFRGFKLNPYFQNETIIKLTPMEGKESPPPDQAKTAS